MTNKIVFLLVFMLSSSNICLAMQNDIIYDYSETNKSDLPLFAKTLHSNIFTANLEIDEEYIINTLKKNINPFEAFQTSPKSEMLNILQVIQRWYWHAQINMEIAEGKEQAIKKIVKTFDVITNYIINNNKEKYKLLIGIKFDAKDCLDYATMVLEGQDFLEVFVHEENFIKTLSDINDNHNNKFDVFTSSIDICFSNQGLGLMIRLITRKSPGLEKTFKSFNFEQCREHLRTLKGNEIFTYMTNELAFTELLLSFCELPKKLDVLKKN